MMQIVIDTNVALRYSPRLRARSAGGIGDLVFLPKSFQGCPRVTMRVPIPDNETLLAGSNSRFIKRGPWKSSCSRTA